MIQKIFTLRVYVIKIIYKIFKSRALFSRVQIFQMNKCSACDTSLQLPAFHFLCKHSYHAHCLESYSEKADCCPACTRDHLKDRYILLECANSYQKIILVFDYNFLFVLFCVTVGKIFRFWGLLTTKLWTSIVIPPTNNFKKRCIFDFVLINVLEKNADRVDVIVRYLQQNSIDCA